jgi:hypothetical protein
MQRLVRLVVVTACVACSTEATNEAVLGRMMRTYKRLEQLAADAAYAEHVALVDDALGLLVSEHEAYRNISRRIGDEVEHEQFSAALFLSDVDSDNNKMFFRNGSCRHHAYRQYRRIHEYHNTDMQVHLTRLASLVAALDERYDAGVRLMKSAGDKIKSTLAASKELHDRNMALIPTRESEPTYPAPGQLKPNTDAFLKTMTYPEDAGPVPP